MATEDLYEVEQILDRRKNKKGRVEYLVRWRGYGPEGDTWEPESHMTTCMVYVHDFNRRREGSLLRSTRGSLLHPGSPAHRTWAPASVDPGDHGHSTFKDPAPAAAAAATPSHHDSVGLKRCPENVFEPRVLNPATPAGSARRSVDLSKSGIKILVPKSPMNPQLDSEESTSEAAHSLDMATQVPPEVAAHSLNQDPPTPQNAVSLDKAPLLSPGEERARMGTRPRCQNSSVPSLPWSNITPTCSITDTGTVATVTSIAGKRRLEERRAFDKRLRFSVRQTESAYRYRDIVVKKQDNFTHILLSTKSSESNGLNPEVMKEIQSAMATAATDESKLVLLSAVGSVFCSGLDFLDFVRRLADDRKKESIKMAETIRTFVNTFIQFRKPIVVAVNGPAVGLGAAMLPLCDVVWANEKSWFQTPYTSCGQTPDACASFTFPRIMGTASANELLLANRKLTAQEASSKGLVSQVLWPQTFFQEVLVRVRELLSVDTQVLLESKALMRNQYRSALEQTNERECEALKRVWSSPQGTDAILQYLQSRPDLS
ncbi:chromodomain Y-like protein [Synchiropus splendidus]|uniref:chromodomain Y-like protein n=1 Tax=Synchiropus splendidus TaxID=270530 RepID=UPI00237E7749|nr:chromodomain Y-like protein [Synchiropus splendidus]